MKNAAKRIFSCKIYADTAENEQHFAEILPKTGNPVDPPGLPGSLGAAELPPVASRGAPELGRRRIATLRGRRRHLLGLAKLVKLLN